MGNAESGPNVPEHVDSSGLSRSTPNRQQETDNRKGLLSVATRQPSKPAMMRRTPTFHPPVTMKSIGDEGQDEEDARQPVYRGRYGGSEHRNPSSPITNTHHMSSPGPSRYDPAHFVPTIDSVASILDNDSSDQEDNSQDKDPYAEEHEISKLLKGISSLGADVLEASAAVFHYLETKNGSSEEEDDGGDDDVSMSGRSHAVMQFLKSETLRGNTKHAYKFLETAKAVSEVLQEESQSAPIPARDRYAQEGDNHSISEESMAIFHVLDNLDGPAALGSPTKVRTEQQTPVSSPTTRDPPGEGSRDALERLPEGWYGTLSPKSQRTLKARGGKLLEEGLYGNANNGDKSDRYLPDIPEIKSTADETDPGDEEDSSTDDSDRDVERPIRMDSEEEGAEQRDYPVIGPIGTSNNNFENRMDLTDLPHLHLIDADIDLEFVEHFDLAFNDFMARHPEFLSRNPDLVHHLRISKLQKLLEYNDTRERDSLTKLAKLQGEKAAMEERMQLQLRDAARKKAARQTFLQSELNNLSWSTKKIQAQLRWKFVEYSVDRAKRQAKLRQQFKAVPHAQNRHDLMPLIPQVQEGRAIRDAIQSHQMREEEARKPFALFADVHQNIQQLEEEQLKDYQSKNVAFKEEVSLLNKRLVYLQMEAKKCAWVESILLGVDEQTMIRLKTRFQKKEGVARV